MPSILVQSNDIDVECPQCKKDVKALMFESKNIDGYKRRHILGCPECNNVFYTIEDIKRH